jgi:hypothetical protein
MNRMFVVLVAVLGLLVLSIGCSKEPVTTNNNTSGDAIAQEFDGLTTSSESPAFGDESIVAEENQEEEYSDPLTVNPMIDSLMRNVDVQVYHFRALWGRLLPDSTVTTKTDWTGSLTLSRGIEILRKVIHFEPGSDSILTRTQRNLIEWVSVTASGNDGIAVDLIIPKPKLHTDTTITYVKDSTGDSTEVLKIDTLPVPPVKLEFKTGPYTNIFSLEELARLDTVVSLTDSNAVAFNAFQMTRIPCPRGFLAGFWGYDSTGLGIFRGSWINHKWEVQGYFQGHFKTDTTGENVFVGKWINKTGDFAGLLKGTWGVNPNENSNEHAKDHAGGWFSGRIFDANIDTIGVVVGSYKNGGEEKPGFLQGRWKLTCPGENAGDPERYDDGMNNQGKNNKGHK